MIETFTKESFWQQLEDEGEEAVRTKVLLKHYGVGNGKLTLAEEWLRRKENTRQAVSQHVAELVNQQNIEADRKIARSSKNAAWVAAAAAILSLPIAVAALWIALHSP